jgi:phage head maturation protease
MPSPDQNPLLTFSGQEPDIEVRSESAREIAILFMKWNEMGLTDQGPEEFEHGAFADTDPTGVVLRSEHEGPPAGRGLALEERADGAVLVFKAAPTPRGDELLTLAKEGYFKGASPSYRPVDGGTRVRYEKGRRVNVRTKVDLREVSLTWRPTFQGTEVLYTRSEGESMAAEDTVEPAATPSPRGIELPFNAEDFEDLQKRLEKMEERSQRDVPTNVPVPAPEKEERTPYRGDWVKGALHLMSGEDLPRELERVLADTISDDNPAFMPTTFSNELIGEIDPFRPFLQSTTQIDMPADGLEISYPRVVQRPLVDEQTDEKTEVASRSVETDRVTSPIRTFAGAGDLSIQLLRRSSPQFLDFYLRLLGEAYATVTEDAAVDALLAAGVTAGTGQFDPAEPTFAEAIENGVAAGRTLVPNRIWLSTTAMSEFIDAKTPAGGGGEPLYPGLAGIAGITGGGGGGPLPISLTPIWVPALDNEAVDVIIGPARGFSWAEQGTFNLQADVPGRLGRDVALAGFVAFVAAYPAAFTTYVVAT